jgi:hypothetical protein
MDVPVDMATGVLDGVCCPALGSHLFFNISSLFCAYLYLSICLFNSFGSVVCPVTISFSIYKVHVYVIVGDILTRIVAVR